MIRINLGADPRRKIRFAFSPLTEAAVALEALVNPKRQPVRLRWVLETKPRLPPDLWREIRCLSFAYKTWQVGLFSPSAEHEVATWDEEIERFKSVPIPIFVADVARAVTPEEFPGFPTADQVLGDAELQAQLLTEARSLSPLYESVIPLLWTDPERLRSRFVSLLQEFWASCFAEEWERVLPVLVESVVQHGAAFGRESFFTALQPLLVGSKLLRRENAILVPRGPDVVLDLDEHDHWLLIPSTFTWAYTRVVCDPPWVPALVYPVATREWADTGLPPEVLAKVLAALANETRLQILHACADIPRSTQELARLMNLTEGVVSRHLRLLEEAGLVAGRRSSYYVLYQAVTRRVRAVSPALLRYLGSSPR